MDAPAGAGPPGYTPLRAYRYERKFLVDTLTPRQVEAVVRLHPRLFYTPYPPRFVNNLYLDTADLEYYYDNVQGAAERRKVRVRWYGELNGPIARPMLELKIKDGLVGTKRSHPLPGFHLGAGFGDGTLQRVFSAAELPPVVGCELRCLSVVLLNRYYRRYYASRDGDFRVTIDTVVTYFRANGGPRNTFLHRQTSGREVIVELKYDVDREQEAGRVASYLPFRVTRNSKYVQGVERVCF
jgi:hypothetical protein